MKVILVNGSPHKEGCTHTALREVADALENNGVQTEIIWLGNGEIAGCIGCGVCAGTGACFRKDIVNEFVEKAGRWVCLWLAGALCGGIRSPDFFFGSRLLFRRR